MDATEAVKDAFLPEGDTADLPSETTGGRPPGRETEEREAARARGLRRTLQRGEDAGDHPASYDGAAARGVTIRTFMALAENVRDYAIFLMDPDGVITYWGEGARLLKWWNRDEMEGAHLRALYLDGGSEDGTAEDHLRQAAERGEYTGEGQSVRSDGSTFWAHVSLTALRGSDGTLLGFAKVTRDLTARHAAEAALKAAREAEEAWRIGEEANRCRAEFLATLSHEIRTPINAIIGYADLLDVEAAASLTDRQRTHVARLRASSEHLLNLVNDVLDLSRMEADRMPLGVVTARIGSAVDDALALVEPQARAKELQLVNDVSGTAAEIPYYGDEGRVRQILVNLLSNAVKFTPAGGRVTVSAGTGENASPDARLSGPGPWAWIRVEDTGPGIPPERLEAIFEPYEQADMARASHHGGTGLGVTISRRLARLMNGDLVARSEVGWGTNFFLWLPAVPDAVTPRPTVITDRQ